MFHDQIIADFIQLASTTKFSDFFETLTVVSPVTQSILMCLTLMVISFVESIRRANYSVVDRLCKIIILQILYNEGQ